MYVSLSHSLPPFPPSPSRQSLLTDPFIETSMEPQISALIRQDPEEYNRIARVWTWRYAMHDVMAVIDECLFDGP